MSDDSQRPIFVKKVKKSAHGHHGGAWKLAYADLVTAMMAFFLLMWLLGSASKSQLQGISEYFQTPLKVALFGGESVGDASSLVKGGGTDLTRSVGQQNEGRTSPNESAIDPEQAEKEVLREEAKRLETLKGRLEELIDQNANLRIYKKQLLIDLTPEGLRIQIMDEKNRPMFDLGSASLKPYTTEILREIGNIFNEVPNRVSISGHTDATSYARGDRAYGNWELSADRANASRRELVVGGMDDKKVIRVVGLGSSVMYDPADPYNPVNRRISVIVLNKKTEAAILANGGRLEPLDPQNTEAISGKTP